MLGTNEMQLNEATMIEAVQLWLDSKMPKSPRVSSVKSSNGYVHPFTIILVERTPVNIAEFK